MKARNVLILGLVCGLTMLSSCRRGPTEPEGEIPTLPPVNPGTVLFLDDFDSENGGRGVYNWTAFANWNVVEGCVDLHGNGFHDVQPGRGLYVDLDGTCGAAGTIETKAALTLQAGNYVLEYWLAGNQRINRPDTVDVSLGTLYAEQLVLQRSDLFTLHSRTVTVTAPTSAKLKFRSYGGDDQGALLDLVRLRRVD